VDAARAREGDAEAMTANIDAMVTLLSGATANPFQLAQAIRLARLSRPTWQETQVYEGMFRYYATRMHTESSASFPQNGVDGFVLRVVESLYAEGEAPSGSDIAQWSRNARVDGGAVMPSVDAESARADARLDAFLDRVSKANAEETLRRAEQRAKWSVIAPPAPPAAPIVIARPRPPAGPPKRMPRAYRGPEVQRNPDISFVWTVPSPKPTPAVSYQVVFPRVEYRRSVEELWTCARPERAPLWRRLGPDLVEDEDPEVPPMWCRKKRHHFPQTLIGPGAFFERATR
jgi:hypothetical protein